ncbi:MAG TPA: hypothetical protein VF701_07885 [Thermoanaerobaculia bacterium]
MTKQKDLKRIVRSRMQKTGEAYTAARSNVLRKSKVTTNPPTESAPDYAALAGKSDATIEAKTGCSWKRWVEHLDYAGAASMTHTQIAAHVHEKFGVSGWWSQTVAVGYERIKGLREIGQRMSGSYEASKSRTFGVGAETLFEYFDDARKRKRWLPDVDLKVRKSSPPKSMRITWPDETSVEIWFTAKDDAKCSVAVQHGKLDSKRRADELKQYWQERFDALAALVTP